VSAVEYLLRGQHDRAIAAYGEVIKIHIRRRSDFLSPPRIGFST